MILSTKIQNGFSIYDYANILYGGFDNVLTLIELNTGFESMDVDVSDFATQQIVYDDKYYSDITIQIELNKLSAVDTIGQIYGLSGQNLYDLNLMVYSGFDNMVKFCLDNNINSTNEQNVAFKIFNFEKVLNNNISLNTIIYKKGYIFATNQSFTPYVPQPSFLLQEDGTGLLQEDGTGIILE